MSMCGAKHTGSGVCQTQVLILTQPLSNFLNVGKVFNLSGTWDLYI